MKYLVQSATDWDANRVLARTGDLLDDMEGAGGAKQRAEFRIDAYKDDQVILRVVEVKRIKRRKRNV